MFVGGEKARMEHGDPLPPEELETLWGRPGFLIRRAHQIAQTLFLEEAGDLAMTATQYGVLRIIAACPGVDQIGVARLLGQDRSTTAFVLDKLVTDGLVERRRSVADRRRRELALTRRAEAVLRDMSGRVRRAQDRLLSPFEPDEAEQLLDMLRTLVDTFNDVARTPLDPAARHRAAPLGP